MVGRFFSRYKVIQTVYFVRCLPLLLVPQICPLNICFSLPSALFRCPKKCSCLFLMVLRRDLLCPVITSSIDFFQSIIIILIIILILQIPAASSLLSMSFVTVQHSHPIRKIDLNYVSFQRVDFGVNFYIFVGEDGLHLDKCVFRQNYSFLYFCVAFGVWSYRSVDRKSEWTMCVDIQAHRDVENRIMLS